MPHFECEDCSKTWSTGNRYIRCANCGSYKIKEITEKLEVFRSNEPAEGDQVIKTTGEYVFEGTVQAIVKKRDGSIRYVIEDDRGLLMIMHRKQLTKK